MADSVWNIFASVIDTVGDVFEKNSQRPRIANKAEIILIKVTARIIKMSIISVQTAQFGSADPGIRLARGPPQRTSISFSIPGIPSVLKNRSGCCLCNVGSGKN